MGDKLVSMASSPANFFVMRIASQFSLSARNTRSVVPRITPHSGGNRPVANMSVLKVSRLFLSYVSGRRVFRGVNIC